MLGVLVVYARAPPCLPRPLSRWGALLSYPTGSCHLVSDELIDRLSPAPDHTRSTAKTPAPCSSSGRHSTPACSCCPAVTGPTPAGVPVMIRSPCATHATCVSALGVVVAPAPQVRPSRFRGEARQQRRSRANVPRTGWSVQSRESAAMVSATFHVSRPCHRAWPRSHSHRHARITRGRDTTQGAWRGAQCQSPASSRRQGSARSVLVWGAPGPWSCAPPARSAHTCATPPTPAPAPPRHPLPHTYHRAERNRRWSGGV